MAEVESIKWDFTKLNYIIKIFFECEKPVADSKLDMTTRQELQNVTIWANCKHIEIHQSEGKSKSIKSTRCLSANT